MTFSIYLVLDFILIIIAAHILHRCWKQGLVASLIRLVGALASYAGAWLISGPISVAVYNGFVKKWMENYAETLVPPGLQALADDVTTAMGSVQMAGEAADGMAERFSVMVGDGLRELMTQVGLTDLPFQLVDPDKLGTEVTTGVLENGRTLAQALAETLLQPLATTLLRVLAFAVVFWVLSAVVSILFRIGVGVNHLPLVGGVNHLLGAGVGLAEAAIVLYILCITLAMVSAVLGGKIEILRWEALSQAKLFRAIVGFRIPGGLGMLG